MQRVARWLWLVTNSVNPYSNPDRTPVHILSSRACLAQSGVTLNGLHWADNEVAPYNYGDVTLMGEAAGLIMRKTAGGKTLYQVRGVQGGIE